MKYDMIKQAAFLERPNRFTAWVELEGERRPCHVKNTGRCRELLVPGAAVYVQYAGNPDRKTQYDLIGVKKGETMINMDSQAPNKVVGEWLAAGGLFSDLTALRPETKYGTSRFDFYIEAEGKRIFMEVKGVTLEEDGVCAFPDAPTQRGAKHLRGLAEAAGQGYGAYVLFVIQMEGVRSLHPNEATDPEFARALRQAAQAGVEVLARSCAVTPQSMTITKPVPVELGCLPSGNNLPLETADIQMPFSFGKISTKPIDF